MSEKNYLDIKKESTYVKEIPWNCKGFDYVVGDIHGQFSNLEKKLKSIGFNPSADRLFCCGDLVDRGEESPRVTEFLQKDWFFSVRGNHDEFVLRSFFNEEGFDNNRWAGEVNGGSWWFDLDQEKKSEIAYMIAKLPYVIELETFRGPVIIVHANLPFFMNWDSAKDKIKTDEITRHFIQWNRDRAHHKKDEVIKGIYKAYFGHTVFPEVTTFGNCTFMDTGSGYENFGGTIYEREYPRLAILKIS